MESKNELSDIVLEKDDGKSLKIKRVLIIIAILIIVFLISLLSMKLINNPAKNETKNIVLPPEPTANVQKTQNSDELFKQVPILEENNTKKDNFDNIVKNLKNREMKSEQNDIKKSVKTEQSQDKEIVTQVKPVVEAAVKPSLKQDKAPAKKVYKNITTKAGRKGVYIQVGATSKYTPNKTFLKKIKDQKFAYKLLPITIKDKRITKILVGPFKNRSIAKQNLDKIKKSLNKHAFIYVIK